MSESEKPPALALGGEFVPLSAYLVRGGALFFIPIVDEERVDMIVGSAWVAHSRGREYNAHRISQSLFFNALTQYNADAEIEVCSDGL